MDRVTSHRSLLAAVLTLLAAPAVAQTIPCPGGVPTNCASPYYWDLHVLDAATLPGGYITPSGIFTVMGPCSRPGVGRLAELIFCAVAWIYRAADNYQRHDRPA